MCKFRRNSTIMASSSNHDIEDKSCSEEENKKSTPSEEQNKLARYGISLFINNRSVEAQELFKNNSESIQMSAGYSFVTFMDALMSFEEDKLQLAYNVLHETEKKCATDIGWLKSMKWRMFGAKNQSLADRLETQIILADTQCCTAILTFLQQDISGFLKGGWVLRKAWKIYQQTYTEIANLYKQKFGYFNLPDPTDFEWHDTSSLSRSSSVTTDGGPSSDWNIPDSRPVSPPSQTDQNGLANEIDSESISRLMSAVCFGHGLLQLGISLLPTSLLKLTNIFGFHGNRTAGISSLMYSRQGSDMRAPLATLALLWYHTIVRPFYALDGNNVKAGIEASNLLMEETADEYGQSALFLFFKGRIYRLDSNISMALESFQSAVANSSQREIKLLAMHEVGWCYLIQLEYAKGEKVFDKLRIGSRWSQSFYTYLTIICSGSCDNKLYHLVQELREMYASSNTKNTQLDVFIKRRIKFLPNTEELFQQTRQKFWKCFVYELIYLWNALPSCSMSDVKKIIQNCNDTVNEDEPMIGLTKLIQGECYHMLGFDDKAINSLRNCLSARSNSVSNDDLYIPAYAEFALASILIKKPETKNEAITLLQHAENHYKDYDFDNKLHVRIQMMLKNVS